MKMHGFVLILKHEKLNFHIIMIVLLISNKRNYMIQIKKLFSKKLKESAIIFFDIISR